MGLEAGRMSERLVGPCHKRREAVLVRTRLAKKALLALPVKTDATMRAAWPIVSAQPGASTDWPDRVMQTA